MNSSTPVSQPTPHNTPSSFSFTKAQRLLNQHDYSPVFNDAPIRASHQHFLILARFNDKPKSRLGLVIAKKHVRKAHERNRIKRFARETFRLRQHNLPAIDAIVLARKGADSLTHQQLQQAFHGLWKRVIKKAAQISQ